MISAKDLKIETSSLNILYAEDEEMLREGMKRTLTKLFQNVYIAKNGQEAFEIFKKESIDVVLTDINMPIMDGTELIQNINKQTDKNTASIIVLSAHNESRLLVKLINLEINNFLNKPLDKQLMINSLYRVCKAINEKKSFDEYEKKLQNEIEAMDRKNRILEQKLNQLAKQTNDNKKNSSKDEGKKEEIVSDNYYATLLIDDKDELADLSVELDNFIAMMFQGEELNEDYLMKLAEVYKKYATILNKYIEFFEIAESLNEFSSIILTLQRKFMKDITKTGIYFESLQMTLESYRENIWNTEAKNPQFYNASLINDIKFIIDFLEDKEVHYNAVEFF